VVTSFVEATTREYQQGRK